jgi:hypothetical protein
MQILPFEEGKVVHNYFYRTKLKEASKMIRLLVNFLEALSHKLELRSLPTFFGLQTLERVLTPQSLHLYKTMNWWRKADWLYDAFLHEKGKFS